MSTPAQPVPGSFQPLKPVGGTFTPLGSQQPSAQPAATPAPAAQPQGSGEGTYSMKNPQGAMEQVPYSKVHSSIQNGYLFGDKGTLQQYARDLSADPMEEDRIDQFLDQHPWIGAPLSALMGAGTGALQLATGLDKTPTTRGETEMQLAAAKPLKGPAQQAGDFAENLGEFFSGEELLGMAGKSVSALPMAQRLKAMTGLAEMLERYPNLAKLVKIGSTAVKQGTVSGAQTYAKTGGDTGAAATTAALTAGTSAVLGGAFSAAGSKVRAKLPTTEKVGGVDMQVPADLHTQEPTPNQVQGQQAIKNAAKGTLQNHLEEVNQSRTPPESAPALPSATGPFEFNLRGVKPEEGTTGPLLHNAEKFEPTASRVPEGQEPGPQNKAALGSDAATVPNRLQQRTQAYTSEITGEPRADEARGAGTLKTQDANIARAHIENLNKVIDSPDFQKMSPEQQADIREARADAQRQMAQYHERVLQQLPQTTHPASQPIDIPSTLRRVASYTDAANELEKTATQGYDLLNDVTGGRFNALRQANKDAWQAYTAASGDEAQAAAEKHLAETNSNIQNMISDLRGVVDNRTLDGFDDAFKNAQALRRVASAVDSTFTGNASGSARSWEYRGFDGNKLMQNLSKLQQQMGTAKLQRLIGRDNLDTLFQVAELNRTQAARGRFGMQVQPVVDSLIKMHVGPIAAGGYLGHLAGIPWEAGAAMGWGTSLGVQRAMNMIVTNPKIAKSFLFALDSGARPEAYGPHIATLIQRAITQNSQEEQRNAK